MESDNLSSLTMSDCTSGLRTGGISYMVISFLENRPCWSISANKDLYYAPTPQKTS